MRLAVRTCLALTVLVCSGCVFSKLGQDLARMEDQVHLFTGFVGSDVLEWCRSSGERSEMGANGCACVE